ncbi:hypothetical protein [uncultured Campylobacter sp.]|uniref:hypothetical protein n=1 Tax=uncultured Campylobacter sp. TaxID=218934 RepID=UPI00261594A4|nr:hypothetical protein [uncultured Campylobacter sp.]
MSPNVIVKFVILFFIRAQSLNVKFSKLDAIVSRAYAKYGAVFKLSVPLLAAVSVFALFNLYDFAKANYALTVFLLALGSPLLTYSFFKAIKSAMAFALFVIPFATVFAIIAVTGAEKLDNSLIRTIAFPMFFTFVWFAMSVIADEDVAQIMNKIVSKLSTLFVTIFILYNYEVLHGILTADAGGYHASGDDLTALDLVFITIRFFTLPSIFTLMIFEIKDYLFTRYSAFVQAQQDRMGDLKNPKSSE